MKKTTKSETITIRVTPEMKEQVQILAAEKDWTVSKWLYNTLVKILDQEEK